MAAPMVVRVMVPSSGRKQNSELMNDAAVLLDPDASADEVRASLRRMQALVKTPKFVQGGSKAATPIVKAVLGIVRARGGPSDEAVLLGVLDTFTSLCKAVKGAAIIVRLENGLPNITSLIAMHIKRVSVQRAGFACLAALAASPQNAIAIAKAGAVQAVLMVLNDKETKYFGVESMDAASLGLQLLSALIKATEATLPLLGTQLIMQAVVNAIYARVGNRKVVTAATEVLYLVVKRYNSEDVSEASMLRYTDKVKEVGGVDAMLVVIGRYSDCAELFKLAYSVLNRLQRTVLTAELLGEFPDARGHLQKVTADDPFNVAMLFPEHREFSTDARQFLDAEHAAALPRRGVPQAISGARPMIRGAGVQASWSRIATPPAATREPFLPPGPEVMAEVMLLNVARWLKTRPLRNRTVYDVHDRTAPCETLFDAARHLVGKDADDNCSTPNRIGVAGASETAPLECGPCAGDEAAVGVAMPARGESICHDDFAAEDVDRSDSGLDAEINELEWSIGALPLVDRKRLSASTAMSVRGQRDSDNDMSDNDDDAVGSGEDDEGGSQGSDRGQDDEDVELLDGEGLDADDLINLLEGEEGEKDAFMESADASVTGNQALTQLETTSPSLDQPTSIAAGGKSEREPGSFFAQLSAALPPLDAAEGLQGKGGVCGRVDGKAGDVVGSEEFEAGSSSHTKSLSPKDVEDVREFGAGSVQRMERTLLFDSRFEGGNLAKVIQVHELEYDLYLMPDINSKAAANGGNTQWYYFAVSNMEAGLEYKFNLVNLVKPDSLYNAGMRPALYSICDAGKGTGWRRVGERIAYYENHFETENGSSYYTLTFSMSFPHTNDVCYLAHCFPYSYSDMSACLADVLSRSNAARMVKMSTLCTTLVGNKCPLLTVTNFASSPEAIARRRAICISARVHPGETCASWTMQGLIEFICGNSPRARILRDNFVFKVVPMLNPDGVINGQYRCSLSGNDLNRQWANPCRMMHPTIYSIKALLRHTKTMRDVSIYCDIHGHSRKCNMFIKNTSLRLKERVFPFLLHNESLMFSYDDCNFKVQRCKESAARVVAWRELAIPNSYTLEMSLGGGDFGHDISVRPPQHFTQEDYLEMGRLLCEAILDMYDPGRVRLEAALAELELVHPEMKRINAAEDILCINPEPRGGRDKGVGDDDEEDKGAGGTGALKKKKDIGGAAAKAGTKKLVGAAKKVVAAKKGPSAGASTGVKKSGGASGVGGGTSSRVRKS